MKRIALITLLACLPGLAISQAQSEPESQSPPQSGDGLSLMERGARDFFDGMMREMAPALEDLSELGDQVGPSLRSFAQEMGPALADILEQVEDWSKYETPEMLPNGDIIIRRKPEVERPDTVPEDAPPTIYLDETPQIDL